MNRMTFSPCWSCAEAAPRASAGCVRRDGAAVVATKAPAMERKCRINRGGVQYLLRPPKGTKTTPNRVVSRDGVNAQRAQKAISFLYPR